MSFSKISPLLLPLVLFSELDYIFLHIPCSGVDRFTCDITRWELKLGLRQLERLQLVSCDLRMRYRLDVFRLFLCWSEVRPGSLCRFSIELLKRTGSIRKWFSGDCEGQFGTGWHGQRQSWTWLCRFLAPFYSIYLLTNLEYCFKRFPFGWRFRTIKDTCLFVT